MNSRTMAGASRPHVAVVDGGFWGSPRPALRRIADFSRDHKTRLYYAACVCLLVAAAGLRFHDLSEHYMRFDEAAAANYSRYSFSDIISNTRYRNSSPILYPLVLWAVQQVESTIFSVRVVPAMASVLTVAVMLFLLPRLGVAWGATFLAALLATLSIESIRHAQDAREYSIDALLAVLMIAGLLRYLRDRRKALLCVSLFLAPLLQYGLVLFGAAVMGAAMVLPLPNLVAPEWSSYLSRIRHWLKQRIALLWPAGCFLAGCAISYAVTVRYQWDQPNFAVDGYLSPYYYQGKFDAHSILSFLIDGIWSLLTYHLPEVVAIAALVAFAILLVTAFLRKFQGKFSDSAIAVLFSFCIIISVSAAVLGIYPLGSTRQGIYLGPIIFLAVGLAFHSGADALASTARQAWLGLLLIVLSASAIALAGVDAIRRIDLYRPYDKGEEIVSVLQEHTQEDDILYYSTGMRHFIEFHRKPNRGRLVFNGKALCWLSTELCFQEMLAEIIPLSGRRRLWLVSHDRWLSLESLAALAAHVSVEHVVSGGRPNLYLIEDTESLTKVATATDMLKNMKPILPRKPSIRSTFDVHLSENMLIYFKEPCGAEDVQETFFLHVDPADASDLPEHRKQHGFDNLDFGYSYELRLAEQCVAWRELPDYDFTSIHTGQFLVNEDGFATNIWEGEIRFDEPLIRSNFDVYLDEDQLTYIKESCAPADTEAGFFLHLLPADVADLPAARQQHGFDNLDFGFNDHSYELRSAEQCVAYRELPDYAITRIRTGQFLVNEDGSYTHLWEEEIRFDE